jgi:hypothetical protein
MFARFCSGAAVFVALVTLVGCACGNRHSPGAFEFALIGDMPYTDEAATNAFPNLIEEINSAHVAFVVHDGDIKSGSTPCTDDLFRERLAQFNSFKQPLIYIFGDNEWQDCGENKTNRFEPVERLQKLREVFTTGDGTLGQHPMKLIRQSEQSQFSAYRENVRWTHSGVLFAGFNIPGAANNYGKPEFAARNEANCSWLKEAFSVAKAQNQRAIMLIIQANPHFDLPATNQVRRGFNEWLKILEEQTVAFGKPVVLVHGDSHYFRIDKPLMGSKSKRRIETFTRVETFGYPDVHWLRARVDPRDSNVFSFNIELVEKNFIHH